jgi:2-polyprenyl-3-methyl-5-hydroxy-6-metoxy-1,4-benzoquinol methylase
MTAVDPHDHEENPNKRVYRSYVSSGAFGTISEGPADLTPRLPYLRRLVGRFFPADKQSAILDLGCGDGGLFSVAQDLGYRQLTGIDLSAEQVQIAHARGLSQIQQAEIIPFLQRKAPGTFDLVVTFDVLEHLTKKELMLVIGEVHRILKDGGRWIIHVPNGQSPFFGRIRYGDFTHELAFTQRSLASVLRVGGFSSIDCFEDQPTPHGVISLVRLVLWKIIRNALRIYIMVETGERGNDLVFSQNFLAIAQKNASSIESNLSG